MATNNNNEELEVARDLAIDRLLLVIVADPDLNPQSQNSAEHASVLLHYAKSEETVKELLLCGASVNSVNMFNETPLHTAIACGRSFKVVRELLKHGADVNAKNHEGNTPLNCAVQKSLKDLMVIRELLEYGADINIRNRECRLCEHNSSPLDNAMCDAECAEMLIKITLLKNFDKDYRNIIDVERYNVSDDFILKESRSNEEVVNIQGAHCVIERVYSLAPRKKFKNYSRIASFLDNCINEIPQMKTDYISNNLSLCEFLTTIEVNKEVLYYVNDEGVKTISNQVFQVLYNNNYPIYRDVISDKIVATLGRASLLNLMNTVEVYTKSDSSNHTQGIQEKTIVLDTYSTHEISQYLTDNELLDFIAAFSGYMDQSSCLKRKFIESSTDTNTRLHEASASIYTKRGRLEEI